MATNGDKPPSLDAFLREAGETVTQAQLFEWLQKVDFAKYLSRPGVLNGLARTYVRAPRLLQNIIAAAFGSYFEHLPIPKRLKRLEKPIRTLAFLLAATVREMPAVLDDQIQQGKIDPNDLKVQEKFFKSKISGPLGNLFRILNSDSDGDDMADKDDKKDDKKKDASTPDPAKAAAVKELELEREEREKRRMRLVGITPAQRRSLGLYERILFIYLARDEGPAPYDIYTVFGLLEYLEHCEGAIQSIPGDMGDTYINAERAVDWFEMRQRELESGASVGINPRTDRMNVLRNEAAIQLALDHFHAFESMLRREGWKHLTPIQKTRLPLWDRLNHMVTPRVRAVWRQRLQSIQDSWIWGAIAAVVVVLALIVPSATTVVSIGAMVLLVISCIAAVLSIGLWALGGGTFAAWCLVISVGFIILWRLVATIGDRGLELVRGVGDFFNPADGTGLIGGTVSDLMADGREMLGLSPRTPHEHADQHAREQLQTDNVAAVKNYVTTITVAAAPLLVLMCVLFIIYRDLTVLPTLAIMIVAAGYLAAEMFTRARYVVRDIDDKRLVAADKRREAFLKVIGWASTGATALFALLFIFGLFLGPNGTDKALVVTQVTGEAVVDRYADRHNIAFNAAEATCYADRELYERQVIAAGGQPGYCERNPNKYPCDCNAPR